MEDEREIRRLIEGWAKAVHNGDLASVVADHTDDIVMFDVPPPYDGIRGIESYTRVWPPFFDFQNNGGSFELVELEVAAGDSVAYATALLLCGTQDELAQNPGLRLRLTFGLRKEQGRWKVAHEHHSFPHEEPS